MIRYALLALLREQSDYGYHLKHRFEARLGHAWQLNVGQVYQTLHALARTGLVRECPGTGEGVLHCRRVFALTPKGERALDRWLRRRPASLRPVRDPLLLRLACLTPDRAAEVLGDVDEHERAWQARLEELRVRRARAVTAGAPAVTLLALAAEQLHVAAQLEWLAQCRTVLGDWPAPARSPSLSAS